MPPAENYRRQVALLIKVAPFVAAEKMFRPEGWNRDQSVPA